MRPIQFILILLLVMVVVTYFRRLRSRLLDRVIAVLFGLVGVVMAVMPDWTNTLAQLVGVGRGADLLTYLGLVGLIFLCLLLYSKLRDLESSLTDLVRAIAIEQAYTPTIADDEEGQVRPANLSDL